MRRGEIYFVTLDPVIGREQGGTRPVLVVSSNSVNQKPLVVTVVPGTDGVNVRRDHPNSVRVPAEESGLPTETVFLCFQCRALDHSRCPPRAAGFLSSLRMDEVGAALQYCLGL